MLVQNWRRFKSVPTQLSVKTFPNQPRCSQVTFPTLGGGAHFYKHPAPETGKHFKILLTGLGRLDPCKIAPSKAGSPHTLVARTRAHVRMARLKHSACVSALCNGWWLKSDPLLILRASPVPQRRGCEISTHLCLCSARPAACGL